ncbi:hypothetical protein FHETE_885 [Fusarium heterosporum]|uniref:Uncharacterized protein n=1 Tax=Fusarium heterosporum TaxID=42747 RepID=A0A8H5X2V1_FUSHE|nr:hypothetical protein FHETE_885 [Fusarium heterosporum]
MGSASSKPPATPEPPQQPPSPTPAPAPSAAPSKQRYRPPKGWISEEEADGYYGRVRDCPRLIARSDSESRRWSGIPNSCTYNRNSRIVACWVDYRGELLEDITRAVRGLDVAKIDFLKVGPYGGEKKNKLVISVVPCTADNREVWKIALKCRDVLRAYQFLHTEVEVREACPDEMKDNPGSKCVEEDDVGDDY